MMFNRSSHLFTRVVWLVLVFATGAAYLGDKALLRKKMLPE
jgi:hypothetical protein